MYGSKYITPEAFESGLEIIGQYIERGKGQGAGLVSVFSTSVLRDAVNSSDFSGKVKELYGIGVEVISGEREACLAFKACSRLIDNTDKSFAVWVDIPDQFIEICIKIDILCKS